MQFSQILLANSFFVRSIPHSHEAYVDCILYSRKRKAKRSQHFLFSVRLAIKLLLTRVWLSAHRHLTNLMPVQKSEKKINKFYFKLKSADQIYMHMQLRTTYYNVKRQVFQTSNCNEGTK